MSILLFKLTAGPLLIALVTQVTRRLGPSAGGWLVGLPLTSGPISVFLALEQGTDYAATAAITSLVGAGTVSLFCLVYALCAARLSRIATLAAALAGYLASVLVLSYIPFTIGTVLATLVVLQGLCLLFVGRDDPPLLPPWWPSGGTFPCAWQRQLQSPLPSRALRTSWDRRVWGFLRPFRPLPASLRSFSTPREIQCPAPLFARCHHLHLGCHRLLPCRSPLSQGNVIGRDLCACRRRGPCVERLHHLSAKTACASPQTQTVRYSKKSPSLRKGPGNDLK